MKLTLTRPDDWHVHLRDGATLNNIVGHTAAQFARAIVMPNLKPPITTTADALAYRQRILAAVPEHLQFEPLMTLYLTEQMSADEIDRAVDCGHVHAVKLYPAGATTNSADGVRRLQAVYPVLARMQARDLPLLVHGEVVTSDVDVFDRERRFIDTQLIALRRDFPALRIVFEHITTQDAAEYVRDSEPGIAATITPQHVLYNRNALFVGGLRPHFYCLPVLKREVHRQALLAAISSGNPRYFLGTDSAPHAQLAKESACGCAGIYSAHAALELYAQAFESIGALDRLEAFASFHGPDFYRLPRNREQITLVRESWQVPASYDYDEQQPLIPLCAGEELAWRLQAS